MSRNYHIEIRLMQDQWCHEDLIATMFSSLHLSYEAPHAWQAGMSKQEMNKSQPVRVLTADLAEIDDISISRLKELGIAVAWRESNIRPVIFDEDED